ncbi:hypothetical protein G7Y89_g2433 [Cudoniella acicularis]|uniref:Uncharacterized protein n=1 Tax=Cudoniella acicularis TaxID=354080 RepID=A0A8H4RUG5_9HELO|nr:hypothetical protein G7Y89_g2433 [Cudoniella acicularis]
MSPVENSQSPRGGAQVLTRDVQVVETTLLPSGRYCRTISDILLSTNSTSALAPWVNKLVTLLSDTFIAGTQETSDPTPSPPSDSSPPHKTQDGFQANTPDPANTNPTATEIIPPHGRQATLSNDSSSLDNNAAKATSTPTSVSESAKSPPATTNLPSSHHEVKLPSLANREPELYEIGKCFNDIWCKVPFKENRLLLSNYFLTDPYPHKYSLFLQKLGIKSLNHFGTSTSWISSAI